MIVSPSTILLWPHIVAFSFPKMGGSRFRFPIDFWRTPGEQVVVCYQVGVRIVVV